MVQTLPVSLYMLGNYFRTIPYSTEEAALRVLLACRTTPFPVCACPARTL
ncbi:MAG: hypothetical protein KOO61_04085 [Spirochaetales bacterium]|nr:hypothetical protein [Spirochaetales bacterium]